MMYLIVDRYVKDDVKVLGRKKYAEFGEHAGGNHETLH